MPLCAQRKAARPVGSHTLSHHEPGGKRAHPISIALLYCQTGHLLMEPMARAVRELASSGKDLFRLKMALVMMTSGLAVKSALYPFSSWLPGSPCQCHGCFQLCFVGAGAEGIHYPALKVYMRILGMDLIIRLRINDLLFRVRNPEPWSLVRPRRCSSIWSSGSLPIHPLPRLDISSWESAWENQVQGWRPQSCT